MTAAEAHAVLAWSGPEGERKPLVERLRAHAQLWRGGSMVEHAWYIDEAADEIDRLRLEVEVLRSYGNKDCTAMADAALEQKRATGNGPWED